MIDVGDARALLGDNSMTNRTVLLAALMTSASILALPNLAMGQEEQQQAQTEIEAVVVTGSRIISGGFEAPTPVTVAPMATLALTTPTNVLDALQEMPQFRGGRSFSSGSKAGIGSGRGQFLNLRGLGSTRNILLLDGIRMAPTTFGGNVNSQIVPQMLLSRVEVVTAGASAVYGSDAISGAINYVLDHDFTGTKVEASMGLSKYGDSFNYRLGAAGGYEFADGKGHLLFSVERFETTGIEMQDRPLQGTISHTVAGRIPGGPRQGTTENPYIIYSGTTWNILSEGGHIAFGPLAGTFFSGFKTSRPFVKGNPTGNSSVSVGGDGVALQINQTISEDADTTTAFARWEFGSNDNINFHVQGLYSLANVDVTGGFNYFDFAHKIYSGNPFLPVDIQAQMTAGGIGILFVNKYITDSPLSPGRDDTDHYTVIAGVDGENDVFGSPFSWNFTLMRGWTHQLAEEIDTPEERPLHAAVDAVIDPATGKIVCNVTLTNPSLYPGCIPFNFLGPLQASQESVNWVHGTSRYDTYTALNSVHLSVAGDTFSLGEADPVSIAFGGEWRWQDLSVTSNSDPAVARGNEGLRSISATAPRFWLANRSSAEAKLNVKEIFGEINVPLVRDELFFQALDVNGAIRLTDYSTSGTVTTWKFGGIWRAADSFLIRATHSKDIKAPSLFDLGSSKTAGRSTLNDPLTGFAAVVLTEGGGNPLLLPEEAKTLSVGVVLRPEFIPGLSVAIDYYDVDLTGAISGVGVSSIVDQCFISGGIDPICKSIDRPLGPTNTTTANFPTLIRTGLVNTSFISTSGLDIEVAYSTDFQGGTLTARSLITYIDKYNTRASTLVPITEQVGHNTTPKIRATVSATYTNGPYSLFFQERIIGGVTRGTGPPLQVYATPTIPAQLYSDLTLGYDLELDKGTVNFFTSIKNIFDNRPPLAPGTVPRYNFPTLGGYDIIGTTVTLGMRARF